jgi:hypothetical protein
LRYAHRYAAGEVSQAHKAVALYRVMHLLYPVGDNVSSCPRASLNGRRQSNVIRVEMGLTRRVDAGLTAADV